MLDPNNLTDRKLLEEARKQQEKFRADPASTSPRQPVSAPIDLQILETMHKALLLVQPFMTDAKKNAYGGSYDAWEQMEKGIAAYQKFRAEAASLPVQQPPHSDEVWIRKIEHGEQPIRWGVYFGSECAWNFPEQERHMAYSLADNLGRILRLNTYDESSEFSASLRNTSLVPEGFPESRVNSPYSFPRAAIGEKGAAPSTPPEYDRCGICGTSWTFNGTFLKCPTCNTTEGK